MSNIQPDTLIQHGSVKVRSLCQSCNNSPYLYVMRCSYMLPAYILDTEQGQLEYNIVELYVIKFDDKPV
jgi:hypothetical protein